MSQIKPLARKSDIVVQELNEETLVYDLISNKALALNQTSALVWKYCNGNHTVADISKMMTVTLKEFVTEDLVLLSLKQLEKENLIGVKALQFSQFEGLSRREIIRKIGLASVIALPVIISVVAPSAVSAGSCAALNNNSMLNFVGCS